MLSDQHKKVLQEDSDLKLEIELQQSLKLDEGITSKELMIQSLDEFGKLDEFKEMDDIIGGMMANATENQQVNQHMSEVRQQRIQKELDEVSRKYGRIMTPS